MIFGALLLLVLGVVLAELSEGGLDAKALALLGVLSALGAAMRPFGAGTAGVETIFFLLVISGRALGPGFGFTLGCTTLFASALITGGVGPVDAVPDVRAARGSASAPGCSPRRPVGASSACSSLYGAASAFVYGFLLNLSFWPFTLGGRDAISRSFPARSVIENLHRYLVFDATTSLGWDTGRAITNALLIAVAGGAVLGALRRAARRASFDAPSSSNRQTRTGVTLSWRRVTPVRTRVGRGGRGARARGGAGRRSCPSRSAGARRRRSSGRVHAALESADRVAAAFDVREVGREHAHVGAGVRDRPAGVLVRDTASTRTCRRTYSLGRISMRCRRVLVLAERLVRGVEHAHPARDPRCADLDHADTQIADAVAAHRRSPTRSASA